MHSKWQMADFFSSYDRSALTKLEGLLGLNTFDPLCLKLVKDYLFRGVPDRVIHHKHATQVTRDWIEEEFQTLSLFGGADCFFIHQAQDLKSDVLERLSHLEISGRFVILSFETTGAGWKKLLKDSVIPVLEIEAPKFWEINKLLDFVASYLRVPVSYEARGWMIDSIENDLSTFYNACCVLKLNHPDAKEITLAQVKELLSEEKLDQFALAGLYSRKKLTPFFDKLVGLEGDFERMRGLFMFMQSHLIKLADVSYLANKPRLSSYDKDLQSASKLWKFSELMREIRRFNDWEILAKRKDQLLWHELRKASLTS